MEKLLTERETLDLLISMDIDVSLSQLRRWRLKRIGPVYRKNRVNGQIRYPESSLREFCANVFYTILPETQS